MAGKGDRRKQTDGSNWGNSISILVAVSVEPLFSGLPMGQGPGGLVFGRITEAETQLVELPFGLTGAQG